MTQKYRTRGFVFKKLDRSEADRSFSVFTEDYGRLEIVGRGIRKINSKLRYGIDNFYYSEIEFVQGKNNKTLTDAVKINNIVKDLKSLDIVYQISDILDKFLKGQEKDKDTFDLLDETFKKLNDNVFTYFVWNFLSLQGYHPQVDVCVCCHGKLNPAEVYFCVKHGGTVCRKCTSGDESKINSDVVKILRIILKKDWPMLSKLKINPISQKLLQEVSQNAINSFCPS